MFRLFSTNFCGHGFNPINSAQHWARSFKRCIPLARPHPEPTRADHIGPDFAFSVQELQHRARSFNECPREGYVQSYSSNFTLIVSAQQRTASVKFRPTVERVIRVVRFSSARRAYHVLDELVWSVSAHSSRFQSCRSCKLHQHQAVVLSRRLELLIIARKTTKTHLLYHTQQTGFLERNWLAMNMKIHWSKKQSNVL